MGDVTAVWFGFEPTDYRSNLAIDLLTSYLTYSATSPLSKEYIEIPKPYCTSIGFYSADRVTKNEIQLWISDVPTKHLDSIAEKVKASIKAIVDRKQLDMERMAMMIRRSRRKVLKSMESGVSNVLANVVIGGKLLLGLTSDWQLMTRFSIRRFRRQRTTHCLPRSRRSRRAGIVDGDTLVKTSQRYFCRSALYHSHR